MSAIPLTCEEMEERLAVLQRASLELVQETSLEDLLERIATIACEQSGARYGAVAVMNEKGELENFIPIGLDLEEIQQIPHPPTGKGMIGALMHSQLPIRVMNIASDPRSIGFPKKHPAMTTFLGVPILRGDQLLGQIYLTDKMSGGGFSGEDEQAIVSLAGYAAAAIVNARLYQKLVERDHILTRRTENLMLLNELATTLASSSNIEEIMDKSLSQVMEHLHLEIGETFLSQTDSKLFTLMLHRGNLLHTLWDRPQYRIGEGAIGIAAKTGQPVLIKIPGDYIAELHPQVSKSNLCQIGCFPLPGQRGVLGVLCVATTHAQPLGELEIQFLTAISSWMGTAVENMRLYIQQRRVAVLEERERIGMDLHDGVIQSIYAAGLTLEHVRLSLSNSPREAQQRLEQVIDDLNSTIRDIRAYILDLRPRQLQNENLLEGVQRLVSEFKANTFIDVSLHGMSESVTNLSTEGALSLFHICQEALANIAKHAHAHHVEIGIWSTADRALLEVSDDGRGFDLQGIRFNLGHGLSNMQTRARNVGGDIEISSDPGSGSTILAWVPMNER